jgi:AAA15 family ATPase/GTPase
MIEKLYTENYKSIVSLELELGRINVFIGENGCGKTNLPVAAIQSQTAKVTSKEMSRRGTKGLLQMK